MKKYLLLFFIFTLVFACKKDSPRPPEAAELAFPEQNTECTTGESINETTSLVEFRWNASKNTDLYEVNATNMDNNTTETISVQNTSVKLTLEKGALYSWMVTSKNSKVEETAVSETWQFYNAGSRATYPPFPAQIVTPSSGATVIKDMNNEVMLDWNGSDIDNDIIRYDIYFSISNPPEDLVSSQLVNTNFKVSVVSDTVYYWKIITEDSEGNKSDSGIYEFKVF